MGVYRRGKIWYIDYYFEGKRIREAVGTNKKEAEKALESRLGEIIQGKFSIEKIKPAPFFENFAKEYLEWAKTNHRSWKSMDLVRIRSLLRFFKGKRLNQITPWLIEKFKSTRKSEVKPATVNRELTVLSSMFSKAIKWKLIHDHPIKGGRVNKLPEQSLKERILSIEEEKILLKFCNEWTKDLIIVALDTGMRLGEILSLTWEQVDFNTKSILVMHTKTGIERRVPMTERVYSVLIKRKEESQISNVFPAIKGDSKSRASTSLKRACQRAKIYGLRFHDLRHTFATRLVTSGVDLATVKKILGHSTIRTTERYLHPSSEEDKRAVIVLNNIAKSIYENVEEKNHNKIIKMVTGKN